MRVDEAYCNHFANRERTFVMLEMGFLIVPMFDVLVNLSSPLLFVVEIASGEPNPSF